MRILLVFASITAFALSSSLVGPRYIKSAHGTYLRAVNCHSDCDALAKDIATLEKECEQWRIERKGDKISFRTVHGPIRYLRARSDSTVDLAKSIACDYLCQITNFIWNQFSD